MSHTRLERGFTLLEMAIVLLVIGILLGSVIAGQNFLKTAALRSTIKQAEEITRAMQDFKTKYLFLPGDFLNATEKWGEGAGCRATAIPDTDPGTCNGDGNELIDTENENFRVWQHLELADLIEGSYRGGPSGVLLVPGVTNPATDVDKGMISTFYFGVTPRASGTPYTSHAFPGDKRHVLVLGGFNDTNPFDKFSGGALFTPEQAWHIDGKLDDQRPGSGIVTTFVPTAPFMPDCATTASVDSTLYKTTVSNEACSLIIKTGF